MWGLWSETGQRWYVAGGVIVCCSYRHLMRAQLIALKAMDKEDYLAMFWVVRKIGKDGEPVRETRRWWKRWM